MRVPSYNDHAINARRNKKSATNRQPDRHEVVTHVSGTICYLCLRSGQCPTRVVGRTRTMFHNTLVGDQVSESQENRAKQQSARRSAWVSDPGELVDSNQPPKCYGIWGCPTSPPRRTALLALKKSVRGDSAVSLRFDTGSSDHLAPLLGFFSDQFAEIRGRSRKHSTPNSARSMTVP